MAARVQGKGWVRAKVQEVTEVRLYIRVNMVAIFYTKIKIDVELFSN